MFSTVHSNSEGILTSHVISETVHGNSEEILTSHIIPKTVHGNSAGILAIRCHSGVWRLFMVIPKQSSSFAKDLLWDLLSSGRLRNPLEEHRAGKVMGGGG